MSLDRTIDALVPDWPPLPPAVRAQVSAHCAAFVRAQLRLAPFHIRAGFGVLFLVYSLFALLHASRSPGASLAAFAALPLPMVSGVERLLRAATMLAFFDQPAVLAAIGEDTPAVRQEKFRALRREAAP